MALELVDIDGIVSELRLASMHIRQMAADYDQWTYWASADVPVNPGPPPTHELERFNQSRRRLAAMLPDDPAVANCGRDSRDALVALQGYLKRALPADGNVDVRGEMAERASLHFQLLASEWFAFSESFAQAVWPDQQRSVAAHSPKMETDTRVNSAIDNEASVAQATGQKNEQLPDGPFGANGFRLNGIEHCGLPAKAWALVNFLWGKANRSAGFDELAVPVWSDHAEDVTSDMVGSHRRAANSFFEKAGFPLRVKVTAATRRVALIASPEKK